MALAHDRDPHRRLRLALPVVVGTVLSGRRQEEGRAALLRHSVPDDGAQCPFYRTPSLDAVKNWADATPRDFVFAWKASRFITHWKRLSDQSQNSIELIEERLKLWGARPVLSCFNSRPR